MIKHARTIVVRTSKKDSALFYHLLEGHEGLCSITTLNFVDGFAGKDYRDVELLVSFDRLDELLALLADLDFVEILA